MTATMTAFGSKVAGNIKKFLPEEFASAEISIEEIVKVNESYPALIVRKTETEATPCINLDSLFRMIEEGIDFETVMQTAAFAAMKRPESLKEECIQDYETEKSSLFIRICDAARNREVLQKAPHKEISGLAILYYLLDEDEETGDMKEIMITNSLLEKFGVSAETLHQDAVESSVKELPVMVQEMENVLLKVMGMDTEVKPVPDTLEEQLRMIRTDERMFVVTNRQSWLGAGAILYPGVAKKITEYFGKNFFLLPSSIHEVILVPDDGEFQVSDLEEMVRSINATEVAEKDRLSDNVYYIATDGTIKLAK